LNSKFDWLKLINGIWIFLYVMAFLGSLIVMGERKFDTVFYWLIGSAFLLMVSYWYFYDHVYKKSRQLKK
jgi:CHASE2 domain-containing sensor protein